jgi:hypothetical protein
MPSGFKIDIVLVKNSEFHQCEFNRKIKSEFLPGFNFYVATAEDIIIKKLDYFREGGSSKHLEDIRAMLTTTPVDKSYLEKWIAELGLSKEWQKI